MLLKTTFLFACCMMASCLISCFVDCNPVPLYFEITGLTSYNQKETSILSEGEPVLWEDFSIIFSFEAHYISEVRSNNGGMLMATSCKDHGQNGDRIGVDTLFVKTINDYNESYPAGLDIHDLIRIQLANGYSPMSAYLNENAEGVTTQYFQLKLSEPPAGDTEFAMEMTYRLNNGEEFTHITQLADLRD